MLHVTEDTPPDMLAGAMNLAVHLPTGRSVKMSVERSTPMMDLLVQITTSQQLQLSNYTLQALGMAPSSEHGDKILPYKPNTPIGTLDTQHVRVVPKSRSLSAVKGSAPGHQPFESTFRLKVHLPRNQLYVTRVSRNVLLEDIMKKVCEEKNLDPVKYEFKHPANLDEVLDPKLTLSDYQITEIYVVSKGTVSLSQAFSSSDIMALRKEEERKQMHSKTGGGVFNLIFRRGKSSMGSGSISSDTRSISPTHSDDSRSVTPPAIQQPIIAPPPPPDRPKPPQRKRRPAPKPPAPATDGSARTSAEDARTSADDARRSSEDARTSAEDAQTSAEVARRSSEGARRSSEEAGEPPRVIESGPVICHSRNSSDSSGYHEASVLSENCNASLPRRPKSAFVGSGEADKMSKVHSQSTTNLSKMASHSKSTTSLGMTGRRKKAAPPPPPAVRASNPSINLGAPSPVVASQPALLKEAAPDPFLARSSNPIPLPRGKSRAPPLPQPRSGNPKSDIDASNERTEDEEKSKSRSSSLTNTLSGEDNGVREENPVSRAGSSDIISRESGVVSVNEVNDTIDSVPEKRVSDVPSVLADDTSNLPRGEEVEPGKISGAEKKPPEVVGVIPKTPEKSKFDTFGKRRLQNLASLTSSFDESSTLSSRTSLASASIDDFSDLDDSVFSRSGSKDPPTRNVFDQLYGMHGLEQADMRNNRSVSSLTSLRSLPGFASGGMRKWNNFEDLDSESLASVGPDCGGGWVVGDSEPVSLASHQPPNSLPSITSNDILPDEESKPFGSTDSGIAQEVPEKAEEDTFTATIPPPPVLDEEELAEETVAEETELDWHYQLPSPPKAFRDSSPPEPLEADVEDSVVTSPELFEKLKTLEERATTVSVVSEEEEEEEAPPLNTLTLEILEKRKSLVYNRELTGLKMAEEEVEQKAPPGLPNFKISAYDKPKQKIKVFEDDTVRSSTLQSVSEPRFVPPSAAVVRSESFSRENAARSLSKPVLRSKSHLTLDGAKYRVEARRGGREEGVSRSNSLYDVSGLQSLGVMRLIQDKLNTPTSSAENLPLQEKPPKPKPPQEAAPPPATPKPPTPEKIYRYSGPPAINMTTWSERPKVPVSVAEDTTSSKLTVTTDNTVKEPAAVVTKINAFDHQRFVSHTTAAGWRRPFGNQRPHSIAIDISRVPVVRSVELKKPFNGAATRVHEEVVVSRVPVVRGFQTNRDGSWAAGRTTTSSTWSGFAPNSRVPFGQATLRRTDSNKLSEVRAGGGDEEVVRPPPPPPPKPVAARPPPEPVLDHRDQLLSAIRSFGGKKGLRGVKA